MNELFPVGKIALEIENKPNSIRERIDSLEKEMLKLEQAPIETTHHFAKGLYAREILIPKGTLLTGKIHKEEHLNIISQGEISVLTEDGVKRIKAPFTMVSRPGTKRVGYAHEDTVWTTIHSSEEKDLEKLEAQLIAKTHSDVEALNEQEVLKLKEAICLG
jgi:hypothetical protein